MITITNYHEINKGVMLASFDVYIQAWGLTIKKCVLFESQGKRWISFPSFRYITDDSETKYVPFIYLDKERKARFDMKVLELIEQGKFDRAKEKPSVHKEQQELAECPF